MFAKAKPQPKAIFETMKVPRALLKMALPTIASQLITLIYNIADTWFIGQTDDPYKVAASSLALTVFIMTVVLANLFGVGGGTLMVRLMGSGQEDEAKKVASLSLVMAGGAALVFSLLSLIFMDPILYLLGASANTIGYARQYLLFVVVLGGVPTVLSQTMSTMVRNTGHAQKAGFGLGMGGVLNVVLDPLFMFVIMPKGMEVTGAAIATMLSNMASLTYFIFTYRKLSRSTLLAIPRRIEKVSKPSIKSLFAVGVPAAAGVLLFDITNMVINRLASGHGDIPLAAMGLVLKMERLPLNIGIGICLGMVPLVAYNFASGDKKRMRAFFRASQVAVVSVALVSVVLYRLFAPYIVGAFIGEAQMCCWAPGF
ncbi:MAG: cation transporter [Christensenellaceae bacterium]|nr:cation transporter [Christensenellaceae bacterium]